MGDPSDIRPVIIYTNTGCPFSSAIRRDLDRRGVAYTEVNITDHPERIPELLKLTRGKRIVPVIVEGDRIRVAPDGGQGF